MTTQTAPVSPSLTTATPPTIDNETGAIISPESEDVQAAQTAEQIFGSEENARNTAGLVQRFVASYEAHKTK